MCLHSCLSYWHANRIFCAPHFTVMHICDLSAVTCSSTLSKKGMISEGRFLISNYHCDFSTNLSKIYLILRGIDRDIKLNVYMSSRKIHVIRVRFQWTWILGTDFRKLSNFMIILLVRADRRTYVRTEMTKLRVAFSSFLTCLISVYFV